MASIKQRRTENIQGNFYVDSTCIDCDTCRWMAPEIFRSSGEQSAVYHQPINDLEELKGMQALLSCPTASIGTVDKPKDIKTAQQSFPIAIENNVYHCGYHSENSYGAASYFIQRSAGNILIDSPRFAPPLVKRLEEMGGVRYMYLTHSDDVADHQKFHDRFNCDRILHVDDITKDTEEVEIKLTDRDPIELDEDVLIIPVPGHSKGHTVLLYQEKFLFTGDHLAWSEYFKNLYAFRRFCWYSWAEQIDSMDKLTNYSFEWVLPGHGRRYHSDRETMKQQMEHCVSWMRENI
jgi:glyoxylase-like metal-dependent hydrolase (beta-lactamase superfamily II)/ferredoxin